MSTIKIFIGNLSGDTEPNDVRVLFEKYGTVEECDVLKNYGFVHMTDKTEANTAIANLDGYNIKGQRMRVELSTGKKGNPKGDRRGSDSYRGGRSRPYPSGPPRRGLPPPPGYDRFDPYYRYPPYPERDPYYRMPPADRYLPRLPPPGDRYGPLPLPRDRLMPEERGGYPPPPDPRDRLMARERLPPYPEERAAAYDRLRAAERAPLPADPYYRERSPPPARPPPEYYDRKVPLMRTPQAPEPAASRLNTTAYPAANGYDYYRRPAATERSDYGASAGGQDYYAPPSRGAGGYDRGMQQQQGANGGGGYGMQQQSQQQNKGYDSQTALQTQPIFF
ncbi:RNA-binding protein lark-like [Littorina saxatilis]|uniref:RRM domain-containing protein n=1 Tax=Littorina saxatilis TaxID=31220 RepID=A0AAN9BFQ4_9CAEN